LNGAVIFFLPKGKKKQLIGKCRIVLNGAVIFFLPKGKKKQFLVVTKMNNNRIS